MLRRPELCSIARCAAESTAFGPICVGRPGRLVLAGIRFSTMYGRAREKGTSITRRAHAGLAIATAALFGVSVYLLAPGPQCTGSFQVRYLGPLSPLIWRGATREECELLAVALIDFDRAGEPLGMTSLALRRALSATVEPRGSRRSTCLYTYTGRTEAETRLVLDELARQLVSGMYTEKQRRHVRSLEILRRQLTAFAERRRIADSPEADTSEPPEQRSYHELDRWVRDSARTLRTTLGQSPDSSCVEYVRQWRAASTKPTNQLALDCEDARPVGVVRWPELSPQCSAGAPNGLAGQFPAWLLSHSSPGSRSWSGRPS